MDLIAHSTEYKKAYKKLREISQIKQKTQISMEERQKINMESHYLLTS